MSTTKHQYENNAFTSQVNSFIETPDQTHAQAIENFLEKLCNVDRAELWSYADDILVPLENTDKQIAVVPSLTQAAIQNKTTQIENHIKSSKNFEPKIDNYFDLNARAVMIYPVMGDNRVVGLVKLFMFVGNSKTFNQRKEETLRSLQNHLFHLFTKEKIDTESPKPKSNPHINTGRSRKDIQLIEELKKKNEQYSNLLKVSEKELESYKEAVAQYKKRDAQHLEIIDKLKHKIRSTQEESPETQTIIATLRNKIQDDEKHYKRNLKKYKELVQRLENKEKLYQEEIKHYQTLVDKYEEQKTEESAPANNTEEKEEKQAVQTAKSAKEDTAVSPIQMYTSNIRTHQNVRILYDLMHFSASAYESASHLEKVLYSTEFLNKLIDKHSLKNSIPVKKYKHTVDQTVEMLQSYQHTVFNDKLNIQVRKHKNVPSDVYCDAEKMQQIVMYLLIDIFEIADVKHPVYIDIRYEKKVITFKIRSKIDPKRKPQPSRFKKSRLFASDDPRLCLEFAQKLAKYVNGEINSDEQEEGYTHIFMISASDSVIN